ncbi:MAG: LuxR C-terminal-related transcriptional regulator [Bacteroidota bacterium]
MKKIILIFGALTLCVLILFRLSSYIVVSESVAVEWIIAGFAILFFVIGIFLNKRSLQKKQLATPTEIDRKMIETLGISKREYEILVKISEGCSNKEIGEALFVSESTVKSHISNLFSKLDVKRRTQALQRAKELKIIG